MTLSQLFPAFRKKRAARLFFATDLHGSDVCFRKFLKAAEFYDVEILIMGGDLTGKELIPIITTNKGFEVFLSGKIVLLESEDDVEGIERSLSMTGTYPYRCSQEEYLLLCSSEEYKFQTMKKVILESLRNWLVIADEKLRTLNMVCYIMPGNDDIPEVDDLIKGFDYVKYSANKIILINDSFQLVSLDQSNITPWNSYREITEDEIGARIKKMMNTVESEIPCIFNIHVPPYGTGLDLAPELNSELQPVIGPIGNKHKPVGSKAVLDAINYYQPVLSLHGHIHESRRSARIGRTLCLNPGSESSTGALCGAIVEISKDKVQSFQFTRG